MATDGCLEPVPWETRNLGIESFVVAASFCRNPDEPVLRGALGGATGRFFVQARCSPDSRVSQVLESNGFYCVEMTLRPSLLLVRSAALDRFSADASRVLPRRYPLADLELTSIASRTGMVEAITAIAAESFVDDRFHVDHNCPAGVAGRRYRLWIADLIGDASVAVDVLLLRGEPVAFMANRGGHLLLAGFDRRHANAGLGEFFWLSVFDRLRASGVERVMTRISVNNIAVLNLYARLNFKFRDPEMTFHLWGPG